MKKIEVLVSTMNKSVDLEKKMCIQSDVIIINQLEEGDSSSKECETKKVRYYEFSERGVGLSRNSALMRAENDISVIADDDMVYVDSYEAIIKNGFAKKPDAEMIVFNVRVHENNQIVERVKKSGKVNLLNCLKYGAVSFAVKTSAIRKNNIYFSLLFGGGAIYGSGEDSLFIWNCIKAKMKVYSSTEVIADVYNDGSSWFVGYNEKFFFDKGALYAALSKKWYKVLCLQMVLRKKKIMCKEIDILKAYRLMLRGAEDFRNR